MPWLEQACAFDSLQKNKSSENFVTSQKIVVINYKGHQILF